MRDMGARGVFVYCADYKYGHSQAISVDQWADGLRLSDAEDQFVCKACGKRGQEGLSAPKGGPMRCALQAAYVKQPDRRKEQYSPVDGVSDFKSSPKIFH